MSRRHHQVSASTRMMMITMLLFGLVSNILISESQIYYQPDYDCNPVTVGPDDPYVAVVAQLLKDIVSSTPQQHDCKFFTSNTDNNGVTAYGYGECDLEYWYQPVGCSECLATLPGAMESLCSTAVGAQVVMGGCYMRYENYKFT